MIDPESLIRNRAIKDHQNACNANSSTGFNSQLEEKEIFFDDRETDMEDFNEYLEKVFPAKEVQATVEATEIATQHFEP